MGRDVFYITTPIYYPNDVPHIGHAYNAVATDFIARFHRLRGEEVFHLTGTDEHGLKLQRAAEEQGMTAQEWVDAMEPRWREVWARLDIAYDDYIRTTEARHTAAVQQLLNAVHDNGKDDIYLGTYEGLYCVSCEAYYTEDELIDGLCPIHERPVERMVEENYFFRLSAYADRLLEHYEAHPEAVEPETRRNEVLSTIRGGLQDFSISRTTFDWGIPLPWDPKHVCYVWFDALTNYITAAGYADDARAVRADVAGEHPLDRQGHPAAARDLLAGDADGRQRRAAHAGLGPRLPDGRRQEDVQDQRHRHPPVRAPGRVRRGLLPLLLHARDPVRAGRQLLLRGDGRAPQRGPRERPRQPHEPRPRDARQQLRRRRPGVHGRGRRVRPAVGDRRSRRALPDATCSASSSRRR